IRDEIALPCRHRREIVPRRILRRTAALAAKTADLASEPRDTLTLRALAELLAIRPRLALRARCDGIPALTAALAKVPTELASSPQVRSVVAALPSDCGR
ncbi:MAG TPA: hypothetical protein VIX73_21655, partial [Kofleriaceae bacterium]